MKHQATKDDIALEALLSAIEDDIEYVGYGYGTEHLLDDLGLPATGLALREFLSVDARGFTFRSFGKNIGYTPYDREVNWRNNSGWRHIFVSTNRGDFCVARYTH